MNEAEIFFNCEHFDLRQVSFVRVMINITRRQEYLVSTGTTMILKLPWNRIQKGVVIDLVVEIRFTFTYSLGITSYNISPIHKFGIMLEYFLYMGCLLFITPMNGNGEVLAPTSPSQPSLLQ